MEELFNMLSSTARIDKSKRKKKQLEQQPISTQLEKEPSEILSKNDYSTKDHSEDKLKHIHREKIASFRNKVGIQISNENKHDPSVPDPISAFSEITTPSWWSEDEKIFSSIHQSIVRNIENGKWINPTPIQMQAIPALLHRRDVLGCAPTGSGKSGAFIVPSLFLSSVPESTYYKTSKTNDKFGIRALYLAPSRELASQLNREVLRIGEGKINGIRSALLSKSNMATICANSNRGGKGLDVLVSTPLRLLECLKGDHGNKLDLGSVRIVVLDEADRLLDAQDGHEKNGTEAQSGSSHAQSFLEQIDSILSHVPTKAVRALFSATIGASVRQLAESILRNQVDICVGTKGGNSTAAGVNNNITQSLMFVGKEEGKLLAIRQIIAKGIKPPVIIFLQSKERAQALYLELLYDKVHVDCVHAGKSQAARDAAVTRFRKGETWVLICTDLCARGLDFKAVNMVINYDLPTSGVTYVHRIGRCGRGGRKGEAITLFTEQDFDHLRNIANVMKLSGCDVPQWMLNVKKERSQQRKIPQKRKQIDTTPSYDKKKMNRKKQYIESSKKKLLKSQE